MKFRKWRNTRTGSIHIVRGYGWITLCGKPVGEATEYPQEWKPTYVVLGACENCLRKWKAQR